LHSLNTHPLIKKYIQNNNFGKHLDLNFSIVKPGVALYVCDIQQKHLATPHAAHGGLIAVLFDSCMGVGALSLVCSSAKIVSTLEMKISFLRAVKPGEKIIVKSNCLKRGNNILHMEANMYNEEDIILAKSSGTFNAFPKEKGGY